MPTVKESKEQREKMGRGGCGATPRCPESFVLSGKSPNLNTGGFTQEPFPNIIDPLPSAANRTSVGLRLALNLEIRLRERCDLSTQQ